jgi:hypothetical protein
MFEALVNWIPQGILLAGYVFLGLLFFRVLCALLETPDALGDLFAGCAEGSHHLSRYLLTFGPMVLAVKFLGGILTGDSIEDVRAAVQFSGWIDIEEVTGAFSVAYLLAKVTNGQILTLFGRRRFE